MSDPGPASAAHRYRLAVAFLKAMRTCEGRQQVDVDNIRLFGDALRHGLPSATRPIQFYLVEQNPRRLGMPEDDPNSRAHQLSHDAMWKRAVICAEAIRDATGGEAAFELARGSAAATMDMDQPAAESARNSTLGKAARELVRGDSRDAEEPFLPASHYEAKFGIPPERLRKAALRKIIRSRWVGRKKLYSDADIRARWPEDFHLERDTP